MFDLLRRPLFAFTDSGASSMVRRQQIMGNLINTEDRMAPAEAPGISKPDQVYSKTASPERRDRM